MRVALLGNPNSGKTSIFNALTGSHQTVGNWPGVTVEQKRGYLKDNHHVEVIDLPGIYSLSPYSPEEKVARDYLMQQQPDCIVNIVDGTNLERNLFLTLQLLELKMPTVLAINMVDLMEKRGITVDIERLSYQLGIPVILVSATKNRGLETMIDSCWHQVKKPMISNVVYDDKIEAAISEIEKLFTKDGLHSKRFLAINALEDAVEDQMTLESDVQKEVEEIRATVEMLYHDDIEAIMVNQRYQRIDQYIKFAVHHKDENPISHKIDRLVTNKWLAFPIFIFVMWAVYYLSIQTVGTMATDYVNDVILGEWIPNALTTLMDKIDVVAWVQDLVLNGIVAGAGAVLGFLPQIAVLFLCLNVLEDCGYMSRIAFVMDRVFRRLGLSGKSFIPILISTGCGVPGIMASRTIENEDDRRMTIMLSTFMPCSAKTAIIALIAGAFFPHLSWVAPSVYFISLLTIILSGMMLNKTKYFHRDDSVFLMELPEYHWPYAKNIFRQTWNKCKSYVKKAATVIFMSSVILWFMSHLNWQFQFVSESQSMLASIGHVLSFIFIPLGFGDWKATVAVMSAFSAKENIINTLGILYNTSVSSANGNEIWQTLRANYTHLEAFSFMIFNVLCTPCFAAIGALKRELMHTKEVIATILFQCGMAYIVSFLIYQYGLVVCYHQFGIGTVFAIVLTMLMIYMLMRKSKATITEEMK